MHRTYLFIIIAGGTSHNIVSCNNISLQDLIAQIHVAIYALHI